MAGTPGPDLNLSEDEQVEAELKRLKEQSPDAASESSDAGVAEAEKPAAEAKAESPAPEPKRAERTPEEEMREGTLRRLLREERRRREQLEREAAARQSPAAEQKPADKPKEPTWEEDPAEYLRRQDEANKAEIRRLREELTQRDQVFQQQSVLQAAQRAEDEFRRTHPDYQSALDHLQSVVEKEWERSGLATAHLNQLREAVRRGRLGEIQFKPYAEKLDEVSRWEDVQTEADKQDRDPEDIALWKIARDTYIDSERQKIITGAQASRRNVAEIVYEMAQDRGYKASNGAAALAADTGEAARQKVLQAQRVGEAANSLSESGSGETPSGPRVIRNRQDILSLDDASLDQLIESGRFREI